MWCFVGVSLGGFWIVMFYDILLLVVGGCLICLVELRFGVLFG